MPFDRKKYLAQYPPAPWAVDQVIRFDREMMVEDICKHGCGHPNKIWMEKHPDSSSVHGCCGCCMTNEEYEKAFKKRRPNGK